MAANQQLIDQVSDEINAAVAKHPRDHFQVAAFDGSAKDKAKQVLTQLTVNLDWMKIFQSVATITAMIVSGQSVMAIVAAVLAMWNTPTPTPPVPGA